MYIEPENLKQIIISAFNDTDLNVSNVTLKPEHTENNLYSAEDILSIFFGFTLLSLVCAAIGYRIRIYNEDNYTPTLRDFPDSPIMSNSSNQYINFTAEVFNGSSDCTPSGNDLNLGWYS